MAEESKQPDDPEPALHGHDPLTDSAGQPWAGRHFEPVAYDGDDGSAPAAIVDAIAQFRAGAIGAGEVLEALRGERLLVPLVARLGEGGDGAHGLRTDKSAELSIVTVRGPDERTVLPAFTSMAAMTRWNANARPIPVQAERVALAAAAEGTDLVVLDPLSDTEFALRRPGVWALGNGSRWLPAPEDPSVLAALEYATQGEPDIRRFEVLDGDPEARLIAPEIVVRLTLREGLDAAAVSELLARLSARWSLSELISERVDSMMVRLA
ncbi:SseB family protein [Naasia lichenicola]|uniref:SseB family protein n=1 Tax=Naasia lichenicola TaxID=2565933 RepID=UPI001E324FFC|nr:SseB family protein [Naasia lichenicola]